MLEVGGWFVPVDNSIVRRNLKTAVNYPETYFKGKSLALDCGSYIGQWSRRLKGDFERVIAFEIDPDNAECTRKNAGVEVVEGCLSHERETVRYMGDREEQSPIYCVAEKGRQASTVILDDLALSPDFIKLDLQGYETFALWGAEETLRRSHPLIFFEHERKCFARYGLDGSEITGFLSMLGATEIKNFGHDKLWGWTS